MTYHILPNFRDPKISRKVEIHANVNFLIKILWSHLMNPRPLQNVQNFCEKNFLDWTSNHKIHENIVPQKFGAIRYCKAFAMYTRSCSSPVIAHMFSKCVIWDCGCKNESENEDQTFYKLPHPLLDKPTHASHLHPGQPLVFACYRPGRV